MTNTIVNRYKNSLHKFGIAGFTFFFVKGMLWLIAPLAFAWLR